MGILTITSEAITATDLSGISETVKVYSAEIDGKKLSDKWIVPNASVDTTEQSNFRTHLIEQGHIFDV